MKVGDYVRTKNGIIAKITDIIEDLSIDCDRDVFDLDNMAMMEIPWNFKDEYIIKSSSNIIDLIEVGDILSFEDYSICRVLEITNNNYYLLKDYGGEQYYENQEFIKDFKSILTKEQFESIAYKVKE